MKKLKSSAREWIFENLLRLIFKFSNSHKLVKFVKRPKDDSIYYDIQFKSKVERTELLEAFENYLTSLTNKNVILDEEKDEVRESKFNFMLPKWKNEGIVPDAVKESLKNFHANKFSVRNGYQTEEESIKKLQKITETLSQDISSSHEGRVLNEEESYLNQTYKDLQDNWITKEIAEGSIDYMKVYKDHQIKVMKRAINENGYEIISEVKNGFIIARIDRHNENPAWNPNLVKDDMNTSCIKPVQGDPSYYVHTLIGSLQTEAESIRTQLSIPDLSKQNFTKDFGVSEDILQNDSYNREQEEINFNKYIQEQDEKAFQNDFESEIDYNSEEWKQFDKEQNEITDQMPIHESEDLISREMHQFALENSLNRFLDEDPGKYMERVKSAIRSKFTKSSLHSMSGAIDIVEKSIETVKSINELAKTFDKKSTVTEFKENPFYRSRDYNKNSK